MARLRPVSRERALTWFFVLGGGEALAAAGYLLSIPRDAKNAALWGYSAERLLLAAFLAAGALLCGWAALAAGRRLAWTVRLLNRMARPRSPERTLAWLAGGCGLAWLVVFLPAARLGVYQAYYERLTPALLWLALLAVQAAVLWVLAFGGVDPAGLRGLLARQKTLLWASAAALAVFLLLWLGIALTGVGIRPDPWHWNEAGAPLLGLQVLGAGAVSLAAGVWVFGEFGSKARPRRARLDLWIGLLLWLGAALAWNAVPFERSHFTSPPVAPNNVYYPASDAEIYDLGAQYLLIGQGLNNHEYFEKPLYLLFLALLHGVGGQDMLRIAGLQAVFLALLPAFVYLIGVSMGRRTGGLLAALLVIGKEVNAIRAVLDIQVAHSRLFLSEMPAALGLALLALVALEWARSPRRKPYLALLAGGLLGLLMLIRTTSLILAPLLLAWLLLQTRPWRARLAAGGLFLLGVMLAITPWLITGRTPSGKIFLAEKIGAVLSARYDPPPLAPTAIAPTAIGPGATASPAATAEPGGDSSAAGTAAPPPAAPAPAADGGDSSGGGVLANLLRFGPSHFMHNQAMAVLAFPLRLRLDDLSKTLEAPYWVINWDGRLEIGQGLLLLLNLALLALGVGAAFYAGGKGAGAWNGLLPLGIFWLYHAANALGRTSGSRYLVPVDWTLLLYFGLGLMQLAAWAAAGLGVRVSEAQTPPDRTAEKEPPAPGLFGRRTADRTLGKTLACGLALALTGSALWWAGALVPVRYPAQDNRAVLESVLPALEAAGVTSEEAFGLLAAPNAVALRGRGLYPKFFAAGHAEKCPLNPAPVLGDGYPQVMLRVIGSGLSCVRLPQMQEPAPIPDAADVVVIGCKTTPREIDGLAIIVEGPEARVLLRDPAAAWTCPLPTPVCRQDGACR